MSGAVVAADDIAVLKQLVVRHKVCWEVVPIWHVPLGGRKVKIGFEVELFGTHDHPKHSPAPGCEECHTIFSDVRRIATAVLPHERSTQPICPRAVRRIVALLAAPEYAERRRRGDRHRPSRCLRRPRRRMRDPLPVRDRARSSGPRPRSLSQRLVATASGERGDLNRRRRGVREANMRRKEQKQPKRWGAMIVAVFFALGSTIRTGEERLGRLHQRRH